MKDNLVLIGMPGVGKSTAGVVAAKLAGYQFLDSDRKLDPEEAERFFFDGRPVSVRDGKRKK